MNYQNRNQIGFTLVELLVTVGIIALLSSILYGSFADARAQARDDARMVQLRELQLAVEQYKNQTGNYPKQCTSEGRWSGQDGSNFACTNGSGEYIEGIVPDYIDALPADPRASSGTNQGFLYRTDSKQARYKILVNSTVEAKTVGSYQHEFARCPYDMGRNWCDSTGPAANTYATFSLGAEAW